MYLCRRTESKPDTEVDFEVIPETTEGTYMGGIGSGRRSRFGRDMVESFRSIDVDQLH